MSGYGKCNKPWDFVNLPGNKRMYHNEEHSIGGARTKKIREVNDAFDGHYR
jgi:hypothetical protein